MQELAKLLKSLAEAEKAKYIASLNLPKGHVGAGGVQGWSAGDLFPMTARGLSGPDIGNAIQAMDMTTGRLGPMHGYPPVVPLGPWAPSPGFASANAMAEEDARMMLASRLAKQLGYRK